MLISQASNTELDYSSDGAKISNLIWRGIIGSNYSSSYYGKETTPLCSGNSMVLAFGATKQHPCCSSAFGVLPCSVVSVLNLENYGHGEFVWEHNGVFPIVVYLFIFSQIPSPCLYNQAIYCTRTRELFVKDLEYVLCLLPSLVCCCLQLISCSYPLSL